MAPMQEGLSGDQQFFLAYAQSFAGKEREATIRQEVLADSHSPVQYRVFTVRNLDSWYGAFDVQLGEKLYLAPADRVRIW
jgi:predicted metalloendopeptidase